MKATIWSAGHVMTGAVWSDGITWKVQEALLPASSVTVRVILTGPVMMVPAAGDWTTSGTASQSSAVSAKLV